MKHQLAPLLILLVVLAGCSGSSSNSRSGNAPVAGQVDTAGTTDPALDNAPNLQSDDPQTDGSGTPPQAINPSTAGEATDDIEPPQNAADADADATQEMQPPPPVVDTVPEVIELNEIEKAIISAARAGGQYPARIDHLNFQDESPGLNVPDVDTPQQNTPFNNTLQRISSEEKFSIGDTVPTHQYSKRQAWNSNESLIAIGEKVLRTNDYKIMVESVPLSSARNWSHSRPEIMYGFQFNNDVLNEFGEYNVAKNRFSLLKKFDNFRHCTIGNGEGSISNDDRFVVFNCRADDERITLISFDIQSRTILGSIVPENSVDWAGISQSGKYIVVANQGSSDADRKLIRYNKDFSEPYLITTKTHHGDLGIDQYGDDVMVMIGPTHFSYFRLKDKLKVTYPITDSSNPTGFGHVSCRNTLRPGWCYVSTYNQVRLAAIMLDYNGNSTLAADADGEYSFEGVRVVEAWGIHRSTSGNYHKTPRVSASPSGTSMVFSSDWYGATGANAYVISAPGSGR